MLTMLAGTPAGIAADGGTAEEDRGVGEAAGVVAADGREGDEPGVVDAVHAGISAAVERSARRVDAFFADDRFYTDTTESYLRVGGEATYESGEDDEYRARVRARLDLPGTRERLRLFVEGGDPEGLEEDGSSSISNALDDNDYEIGLETRLENTGRWDLRPAVGVKAAGPADPFVRVRAIRYMPLGQWLARFGAGVAEFWDDGTEVGARMDFDRKIRPDWLFRATSRARYRDSKDRIEAMQQFSLFQKVNDRVGMGYDAGVLADDDPHWEVDHYFTQVRARFRAYRKWFFVELRPQLIFREEDDYDPSFRFSLQADVVFGERYRYSVADPRPDGEPADVEGP